MLDNRTFVRIFSIQLNIVHMKKLLILAILFSICSSMDAQPIRIAITNATVIDMNNGNLIKNQTIIIEGNTITSVSGKSAVPKNATVIDAKGKYVMPGLWDMHAHAFADRKFEWLFPSLIANGVTGVRELGTGVPYDSIHLIIKQVNEGKLVGPRFGAVTQLIFNGTPMPGWPIMAVTNPSDARELVKKHKENGMDFIKVYNTLAPEILLAITEEAKLQGLPVGGHVPYEMSAGEASDLGFVSIEHNTDIIMSCSSNETILRPQLDSFKNLGTGASRRQEIEFKAMQTFDEQKAIELFKKFVRNGTSLCPTLVIPARNIKTADELAKDDRTKYIPQSLRDRWYNQMSQIPRGNPSDPRIKLLLEKRISIVGLMQRSGVNILAGSDFPNPYVYPGFSLHDELELLVQGGLTPLQALQAATINAAKFFHREKDLGTIEKGKLADVIILDENPLDKIGNSKKLFAVVANGRVFMRKDLDELLNQVVGISTPTQR